ncbi:MAG: hypothetical protein NC453_23030 [Muribaculum sp.]|nr:hypothetical protein [Muribaculum sp.]
MRVRSHITHTAISMYFVDLNYRCKVNKNILPQFSVIKTWGKEDDLKQLKSELATLDRKIAAALAPKHDEKDGEEIKRDEPQQKQESKTIDVPTQSQSSVPKKFNIRHLTFLNKDRSHSVKPDL